MNDTGNPPGLQRITLADTVFNLARNEGAEYPIVAESSDGTAVIMDTASGRVWKIELRELK